MLILLAACAGGGAGAREAMQFTPTQKAHWAWRQPAKPPLPQVRDTRWVRNPIDAFVLAKLEGNGLAPAAPAAPQELIRRVAFDLTGLPPTLEEVAEFMRDYSNSKASSRPDPATDAEGSRVGGRVGGR